MKRWTKFLLAMTVISSAAVGCGDDDDDKDSAGGSGKCAQAVKILNDCDMDTSDFGSCGAAEQKVADCVINYPKSACSEDLDESEDFFNCVSK